VSSADRALRETDLADSWLEQFERWFEEAARAGIGEPEAMVLATAAPNGTPSARTVLLKARDERGFVFFTNHGSRKGRELEANPHAALLFPWYALERQVIVTGAVARISPEQSDAYFQSRPYGAQIGAYASRQSSVIADRAALESAREETEARFPAGAQVPRPPWWGGYRLEPDSVEFWQGRRERLHDRLRFSRRPGGAAGWALERLAP
jgi:pyridoxamine 5'-phosphate oxidase